MSRRQARTLALQSLYQMDTVGRAPNQALAQLLQAKTLPSPSADFARQLEEGVVNNMAAIDSVITRFASAFPLSQLAPIDRNILRLAIFELLFDNKVPAKVAINEAVVLAKTYGSEASSRFVNGVLGAAIKEKEVRGCPPSSSG